MPSGLPPETDMLADSVPAACPRRARFDAVTKVGTPIIHLSFTRHQVKDLPPVAIDHPPG